MTFVFTALVSEYKAIISQKELQQKSKTDSKHLPVNFVLKIVLQITSTNRQVRVKKV